MKLKLIIQSAESGITMVKDINYSEEDIEHIKLSFNCGRESAINLMKNETMDDYEQGFYRCMFIPPTFITSICDDLQRYDNG